MLEGMPGPGPGMTTEGNTGHDMEMPAPWVMLSGAWYTGAAGAPA